MWAPLGLSSPGPQSLPHRQAGLSCEKCHQSESSPKEACVGCHGNHGSRRAGHVDLRRRGKLGCVSCHSIHRRDEGVHFDPTGKIVRYGTGFEKEVSIDSAFLSRRPLSVPLVPLAACQSCHDEENPRDPIASCLLPGQEALGPARPTVCFDEHRSVATVTGVGAKVRPGVTTERDAAWQAARQVAAQSASAAIPVRASYEALLWVLSGGFIGLLVLFVWNWLRSSRQRIGDGAAAVKPAEVVRLPRINEATCLGCYACVDACPYDVLAIERYVAKVARPDDCCGLTLCEQRCPNGSLVVQEGELISDRLRLSEELEVVGREGLFVAGDISGLPLIRNAINQGSQVVRTIAKRRHKKRDKVLDLIVVGAGPAGISALLEAKAAGLSALALEQFSVAASIKSFPRGKLVFAQPLELPLSGKLWLEESTKEELLAKWTRIVRKAAVDIREGYRVTEVDRPAAGQPYAVVAQGRGRRVELLAWQVVIAIGRRGTPRKLDVPISAEVEARVHYSLADARSFAGARVVVVGLGDAAMEASIALASQPETRVTVVHRGSGFSRGKARNIAELRRLVATGRVELCLESAVKSISKDGVRVASPTKELVFPCDALFVMIGALVPWDFLGRLGVQRMTGSVDS